MDTRIAHWSPAELDRLHQQARQHAAALRQQAFEDAAVWLARAAAGGLEQIARWLRAQTLSTPTPQAIAASRSAAS